MSADVQASLVNIPESAHSNEEACSAMLSSKKPPVCGSLEKTWTRGTFRQGVCLLRTPCDTSVSGSSGPISSRVHRQC